MKLSRPRLHSALASGLNLVDKELKNQGVMLSASALGGILQKTLDLVIRAAKSTNEDRSAFTEDTDALSELIEEIRQAPGADEADTSFWTADKAQNPKSAEVVVAAADKAPGELLGFQVHGKWFNIKRKSRTSYFLSASRGSRSRWGTRKEILQDVDRVLKTGSLPHAEGSGW